MCVCCGGARVPVREPSGRAWCRFERQAARPFTPRKNARPSQLTGVGSRPEDPSVGGRFSLCSAIELRPEGRRDSNPQPQESEGTPDFATGRLRLSRCATTAEASSGCEARARTWTSCFRDRCGSVSTTSHGSGSRHVQVCRTDGGIRTRTDGGLSAVPLPVGLRQRVGLRVVARAGIEPACRAYETPLDPVPSPCDRSYSNRLPPGPRPGVSTTSDLGHRRRGGIRTPGFLHVGQAVFR